MSHKTELATKLNNGYYLKKALDKLGLKYREAEPGKKLKTVGYYGVHEEVDILLEDQNYAVGFRKMPDGTYNAVGDFFRMKLPNGTSVDARTFTGEITASAKELEITDHLQNIGFICDPNQRKENEEYIELVYTRVS